MDKKYILSIDQGTTNTRVIIFDHEAKIVDSAHRGITQFYPKQGWVEHDAKEIWNTVKDSMAEIFARGKVKPEDIMAIGITDQRETTVLWDRETGEPIYNAICWQSRQTASICEELKELGIEEKVRKKTGLLIDPYFSASKILFIQRNAEGAAKKIEQGKILAGTIDSWIIWNLSGRQSHVTDYTNASRTLLLDIHTLKWDDELCDSMGIDKRMLPKLMPSSCAALAVTHKSEFFGYEVPISGAAGDQHAATFGQGCFEPGQAKNTYGTSMALFMNTGKTPIISNNGLTTDLGWVVDGEVSYALEGVVFVGGAAVQWLHDGLGIITESSECSVLAQSTKDTGGVYHVPAYAGLCAPYWDPYARGMIIGITRGTTKEQICRATLEALGYQTRDVLDAMSADSKYSLNSLKVDGGATKSEFLLQFQADILGIPVELPEVTEMAALGAAYMAGLGVGFWKDKSELSKHRKIAKMYEPNMSKDRRDELYDGWQRAVKRCMKWSSE